MGWRYQIPLLVDMGMRVVAPDMMGYGGTVRQIQRFCDSGYCTETDMFRMRPKFRQTRSSCMDSREHHMTLLHWLKKSMRRRSFLVVMTGRRLLYVCVEIRLLTTCSGEVSSSGELLSGKFPGILTTIYGTNSLPPQVPQAHHTRLLNLHTIYRSFRQVLLHRRSGQRPITPIRLPDSSRFGRSGKERQR